MSKIIAGPLFHTPAQAGAQEPPRVALLRVTSEGAEPIAVMSLDTARRIHDELGRAIEVALKASR